MVKWSLVSHRCRPVTYYRRFCTPMTVNLSDRRISPSWDWYFELVTVGVDKESSIEPGDLMISCVFLELHFFTFFSTSFFLVTRMIFHLNSHTFNLNSYPLAEGTSLPVHFSTTGSSINGSPLEHRHGVWIVFMQRTKLLLIFTELQNFS